MHSNTSHMQATRAKAAAVHPTVRARVGARWPTGAIFELMLLFAPDAQTYCALVQACRGFRDAVHAGFAAALPWARWAALLKILRTSTVLAKLSRGGTTPPRALLAALVPGEITETGRSARGIAQISQA